MSRIYAITAICYLHSTLTASLITCSAGARTLLCILPFLFGTLTARAQSAAEEPFATVITPDFGAVTWERLVAAESEPHNWLSYSGTHSSQRFSKLDVIDRYNVNQLEMKWAYQIPVIDRAETVPLVVDGIMFITEAPSNVVAVDARTGREYWRFDYQIPDDIRICCGRNNRGVALLGETLFMSTLDAHLVAIDARTGNLLWDVTVADYKAGYSKTAAPLIVKDKVITGIAGGEYGIRGFIDAYDAKTGELAWRTYAIPVRVSLAMITGQETLGRLAAQQHGSQALTMPIST